MSDIKGTITRGKGEAVVVEVKIEGKLNNKEHWEECLEKMRALLKQYGSISVRAVKKR